MNHAGAWSGKTLLPAAGQVSCGWLVGHQQSGAGGGAPTALAEPRLNFWPARCGMKRAPPRRHRPWSPARGRGQPRSSGIWQCFGGESCFRGVAVVGVCAGAQAGVHPAHSKGLCKPQTSSSWLQARGEAAAREPTQGRSAGIPNARPHLCPQTLHERFKRPHERARG